MYEVKPTSRFKRDLKYIERRGYDMHLITTVIQTLASGEPLAEKHKDHALSGVCFDSHPHRNPQRLVRIR